jgi:hypothetical protein
MAWVAIGLTLAAFAYSLYMQSKIGAVKQATQKFDGPTAEEGIAIPVVFGTRTVTNCNVTAFVNRAVSTSQVDGVTKSYTASMQLGVCHGKVDALLGIDVGGTSCLDVNDATADANVRLIAFDTTHKTELTTGTFGNGEFRLGLANLSTVDAGVADFMAEKLGMPSGIGPRYQGIATLLVKWLGLSSSPTMSPLSVTVKRIHTRHGGTEAQWYDEKAEISAGVRSREDVWKYYIVEKTNTTDYSGISVDDSAWRQGKGGIGNGSVLWYPSQEFESYTTVPRNMTCIAGDVLGGTLIGGHPNYSVPEGMKIWIRWDMGPMLKFDTAVQCWHDDSARLWVNGNEVTLTTNLDLVDEHFMSTATIPAAYIDEDGPNIIAYRVQDSYAADGTTKIGSPKLIYAGIQVGADAGSEPPPGVGSMNFAHMVHEVLTDKVWGMCYNDADLDDTAFRAAADTLYAEGLGGSFEWSQQMTIEDFLTDIMRHISGSLYIARDTGLFTLKLIRADYTVGDLVVLDESNISEIEEADRKQPGELVNCVTVTYASNLRGDQGTTAPLFDDGLVDIQGGVVSAQVDYPAITSPVNAAKLALRDLRILSAPILNVKLVADRAAANLHPGQPFVLNWPTLGLINFVMRVSEIDVGNGLDGRVKITCLEDVFFFPSQVMVVPNDPVGLTPVTAPTPTVDMDEYKTGLTIDTRNREPSEFVFCPTTHVADGGSPFIDNGGAVGWTMTEPGVMVCDDIGPGAFGGRSDGVDVFEGDSGTAPYVSWMIGRIVWVGKPDNASYIDQEKAGPYVVDDVGGYRGDDLVFVATYARMHRAPGFNASAHFAKDMVVQVRAGTAYGGHFLQLDTANVVLGTTEQVWTDIGTTFTRVDTYDLLRPDQFAGRNVSPDSFLVVSATRPSGSCPLSNSFATLVGTPNAARIPAGKHTIRAANVGLSGGDVGAITTLGFKLFRSGVTPATLYEVQTAALVDGYNEIPEMSYQAPEFPLVSTDLLVLIPTLHTNSTTPVTLTLAFNAAYAITLRMPRAVTGGLLPISEEWFDVTIVDGVISGFGDKRNLRVHGAGPLVGIDTTTSTGGTRLLLAFVDATSITADGTPSSGARILTEKQGEATYNDMGIPAESIITLALLTDSGSASFWKFAGGSTG